MAPVVSYRLQAFQFDGCGMWGMSPSGAPQCIGAQGRRGRRVLIHPQEGMLTAAARALQQSAAYRRVPERSDEW